VSREGDRVSGEASGRSALRVALFTNNYLPRLSGVAVAVDFLERALRAAGHETLVVAPDYAAAGGTGAPRVRRVGSLPLRRLGAAIPLPVLDSPLREVAEFAPDVLHAHHPMLLGESARAAADRLGVPLVYTFHTLYETFLHHVGLDFRLVERLVQAFVRRFVARCDLVVAPTEQVRLHLVRDLRVAVPTATAPTGLECDRFRPLAPAERARLRAALGLDGRRPLLVWAGRVTEEKDPRLALATLGRLVERGHDAGLVVLGDGPAARPLAEAARTSGLAGRVAFAGLVDQRRLPALLAAGDLFLFTSAADTQGIVGYEAWAAGLPIVAVPSMAGRAVVESGANGLLAERDATAFANAVESLLARPELGSAPFPWDRLGAPALAETWSRIYDAAIALGRRADARRRFAATPEPAPVVVRRS
jgi:glycosyltransferase involved in cell wall biosynthesis